MGRDKHEFISQYELMTINNDTQPMDTKPVTATVTTARPRHPGVGRGQLYKGLRSGRLPSVRNGRKYVFAIEDLDRWVWQGCPTDKD